MKGGVQMGQTALIRPETPPDHHAIRRVNTLAFGRPHEGALVDALRRAAQPYISLVAKVDGQVVGHIFFSPVTIESAEGECPAFGLGPMSVLPEYQRQGIGSQLVQQGLEACARIGQGVVVVLGHPQFYPRFGFVQAHTKELHCEYAVPDEDFMVVELVPGALQGRPGLVKYLPEFAQV
jgi:putative acetyltransferase